MLQKGWTLFPRETGNRFQFKPFVLAHPDDVILKTCQPTLLVMPVKKGEENGDFHKMLLHISPS